MPPVFTETALPGSARASTTSSNPPMPLQSFREPPAPAQSFASSEVYPLVADVRSESEAPVSSLDAVQPAPARRDAREREATARTDRVCIHSLLANYMPRAVVPESAQMQPFLRNRGDGTREPDGQPRSTHIYPLREKLRKSRGWAPSKGSRAALSAFVGDRS